MRRYIGEEELELLREVVESQELWRGAEGNFVPQFEKAVGKWLGRKYVYGVNSGTSANEAIVAGLGLEPALASSKENTSFEEPWSAIWC